MFNDLKTNILDNKFLKSVFTLSSGVVIAQLINFVGMPFVSRVYSAAAIGDYTIITSNSNVISSVAVLGMMTTFMLPKEDQEARGLCKLVTLALLVITSICSLALLLIAPYWRFFSTEEVPYSLSILVLWMYTISYMINNICYAYINRKSLYNVMFWNPIIGSFFNVGVGILFGILGFGFLGYTFAHIISNIVNIVHLLWHANPYRKDKADRFCTYFMLLKKYKDFPVYQMPANIISSIANQIPLQIIEAFFSSTILGYYSMANKIMSIPLLLLATPINRVYYQEASRRYVDGEDIAEFGFKIMEANVKIAIIPVAILMVFGQWIFALFLGDQWKEAGSYAAVLGIYFLIQFCVNCLAGSFVIIGKSNWNLVCSGINVLLGMVLFVIAKVFADITIYEYLLIMALLSTTERVIEEGVYFCYMGIPLRKYIKFIIKYIAIPFVFAFVIQYMIKTLK